ncbi:MULTISPECIES: S24 family peptidase [unclassified Leeuwenhoekiella]|uniref:S24 family peptidase n=1 Tax=unclassified Leeuwenhoekiella TaxID=2615029 RepID=UPI000C510AC1|nr:MULTISPECIES: S24 family peptidase [unclassified Leeuwenhoekiella]MAW94992.1 peptidase S24 [Leeuwenhoekiella sp.]MBA79712.1 peptidase S24 [Leeuwenhoekiella sp.]|tara:strand:+ start:4231 stop:4602 length:372 start_codon:yes stop_codon:yes gene_type:complete
MEIDFVAPVTVPDEVHQAGTSEQTGFPSPATHYLESRIDLNRILTKNRDATFFIRIKGDGYREYQILDKDVVIVDRSLPPHPGKLAVVVEDGNFKIQRLVSNLKDREELTLWGMITFIIHDVK